MQALDLLLQSLISENKSMDEMCFLLQVRPALARGAAAAPGAHPGRLPRTQRWPEGQVGRSALLQGGGDPDSPLGTPAGREEVWDGLRPPRGRGDIRRQRSQTCWLPMAPGGQAGGGDRGAF